MNEHSTLSNRISDWLRQYYIVDEIRETNTFFEARCTSGNDQNFVAEIMKFDKPTITFYIPNCDEDSKVDLDNMELMKKSLIEIYDKYNK